MGKGKDHFFLEARINKKMMAKKIKEKDSFFSLYTFEEGAAKHFGNNKINTKIEFNSTSNTENNNGFSE